MATSRATPEPGRPLAAVESVPFTSAELEDAVFSRFERIAARFPDREAVREPGAGTSYARLLEDAVRLGAALETPLAGAPGPVALVLDPGATLFAGMLGALRAARPYAAVDPRLPDARVEAMLRALDPAAVVADAEGLSRARRLLPNAAPVFTAADLLEGAGGRSLQVPPRAEDPAYVVFTSGSTSAPRGVVQSHRNLLHNVARLSRGVGVSPSDRITLLSSPSFGASVSDVFGALLNGAAVCPYSLAGDGLRRLPEWLERERITILHCVPSVFRSLAWTLDGGQDLSRVRTIKLGGEAVLAADLDLFRNRFPAGAVFHVGYGASEINVMRQWFAGHDTPWPGASPLGHAVDGVEVVLLDESGRETGGEGEIGIVSDTLALGYWRDPERTSATFVPVPGRPGVRLYRTGDLGRLLPDGCLLHLGRRDARLKVRGHRVEAAEVEGELLALAGVREAAVDARALEAGVRLVAWIAREDASMGRSPLDAAAVRRALAARLPSAMVPAHVVFVPALPRTPGGKVDRRALADPRPDALAASTVPSAGGDAARIAEVFGRVLGAAAAVDGDFFDLGGDSLSAVELLVEIERELGVELTVADLLEGATPSALAARASSARARGGESQRDGGGMVRLSPGDGVPVVVVPGGGGDGEDLFVARRLARLAGAAHPFFSLRSGRPPHPPLDELAASCVARIRAERPRGPYVLVGDCVGGVLAVAIAERLRGAGEDVAPPILVDAPFPGAARRARSGMLRHAAWLGGLGRRAAYLAARVRHHAAVARRLRDDRLGYLRRQILVAARGLTPGASAREREARARRDSWVAALMGAAPPRFDGPLRLIETDEGARRGFGRAWSAAAAGVETVRVAGAHTRLILDHGEEVAAALRRWLAETHPPGKGTGAEAGTGPTR